MRTEVASVFDAFPKSALCFAALVSLRAFGSGRVTNCTEANFRAALAGGGQVVFACSGTLALSNTIAVFTNTLILGSGYNVTVDGGNAVQLFRVNTNVTLEIHDLILANGASIGITGGPGSGGGILNNGGAVTLFGCTLTNLAATSIRQGNLVGDDGFGGAICNFGGTLSLTNCTFSRNQASGGIGGQASGGAIYSDGGVVSLNNVLFSGNLATGGGYYPFSSNGGNGAGGAVFSRNSRLFVTGSSFVGNTAAGGGYLGDPSIEAGYSGSGLGGAFYLSADSTGLYQHCSFVTNQANGAYGGGPFNAAPGIGQGGAIYNLGSVQTLDSLFTTNTCQGGAGGGRNFAVGQGGALYSANILLISGCTFAGNTAFAWYAQASSGGAVWSSGDLRATNSTFVGNSAAAAGPSGGGAYLAGGTGILMNLTISGNLATGYGTFLGCGGGLSCTTNATVTVRNSIIANSGDFGGDTWGAFTDAGYNICSDATAKLSATGSLNSTDPLLGPLTDNGGPTLTMVLSNGSPALDAIPSGFPPVDQRGVMRPQGVAADIGAVEGGKIQSVSSQIILEPSRTELSIMIQATAGASYRLLASPDLVNWTGAASLSTNSSGPVQFTQPVLPVSQQFFEVLSP